MVIDYDGTVIKHTLQSIFNNLSSNGVQLYDRLPVEIETVGTEFRKSLRKL